MEKKFPVIQYDFKEKGRFGGDVMNMSINEKLKPKNEVQLRGTLIGMKSTTKLTSFVIVTDGGEEKGSTVVNVIFYGTVKGTFKVKDHVDIVAHMQSKIIKTEDGKRSYHQMVIGNAIKKTNRLLYDYLPIDDFKSQEGGIPDDVNKAFIYGKVSRVFVPNDNYAIVTVLVPTENNKANFCDVICYKRQAKVASLLNEGDFVVSIGEIRSSKERPAANEIFKQCVICKDVARIKEEDFDASSYTEE